MDTDEAADVEATLDPDVDDDKVDGNNGEEEEEGVPAPLAAVGDAIKEAAPWAVGTLARPNMFSLPRLATSEALGISVAAGTDSERVGSGEGEAGWKEETPSVDMTELEEPVELTEGADATDDVDTDGANEGVCRTRGSNLAETEVVDADAVSSANIAEAHVVSPIPVDSEEAVAVAVAVAIAVCA